MLETVLVSAIAAVPPTTAAIASWVYAVRAHHRVRSIDRAVNHRPDGEPTLYELLADCRGDLRILHKEMAGVHKRLDRVDDRIDRAVTR